MKLEGKCFVNKRTTYTGFPKWSDTIVLDQCAPKHSLLFFRSCQQLITLNNPLDTAVNIRCNNSNTGHYTVTGFADGYVCDLTFEACVDSLKLYALLSAI